MAKLAELTKLIRSKNAGPFQLTFDIMFEAPDKYEHVKRLQILNKKLISDLYGVSEAEIEIYEYDSAYSIKITIPRPYISGALDDTDVFGGQQYGPIVYLEIPEV